MKILSIETTSTVGSLAIIEEGRITKEYLWETSDIAAEIMENLDRFLWRYPLKPVEFDYLVVSTGPGSWTGIRIGISLAKGLVAGNRKKIYCVSVPESLFFPMSHSSNRFCCLVNAYQGKFYYAFHKGKFLLNKKITVKSAPIGEIIKSITEKTVLIGPGVLNIIKNKPSLCPLPWRERNIGEGEEYYERGPGKFLQFSSPYFWYPRAGINGLLSFNKMKNGISSPVPEPFYGK